MRLRERDLTTVWVAEPVKATTARGYDNGATYGARTPVKLLIQSASGGLVQAIYGKQVSSVKAAKYQGDFIDEHKSENWGVWLSDAPDQDKPDYTIDSVQPFSQHKNILMS